ncbi:hypothetical protein JTB14_006916 [Gonioctena quinquepunctata]|nr:hypothetical protein JTB14_006916 [Gonioctena quinquepunctata]
MSEKKMKYLLIPVFILFFHQSYVYTEPCNNPKVSRNQVFIYRISQEIPVKVIHCQFIEEQHPAVSYTDISKNCIEAAETGIFVDKWGEKIKINSEQIILGEYISKADLTRNEIVLKSGTVCRYDRGFCYDPKESFNYAVVWKVINKPMEKCPKMSEEVFYGYVDFWEFPERRLKYLFYYDESQEGAFHLKLAKTVCNKKDIWLTEANDLVVSRKKLSTQSRPSLNTGELYFPLNSKRIVSEIIMMNCDLQEYMQDLEKDYRDPETVRAITAILQKMQTDTKVEIEQDLWNSIRNLTIDVRTG